MKYSVVVTFSIEGFHCWPDAKDIFPEVAFLSERHRHMFGFRCYARVTHTDRDEEFILLMLDCEDAALLKKTDSIKVVYADYSLYCTTVHNMQHVTPDDYKFDRQ